LLLSFVVDLTLIVVNHRSGLVHFRLFQLVALFLELLHQLSWLKMIVKLLEQECETCRQTGERCLIGRLELIVARNPQQTIEHVEVVQPAILKGVNRLNASSSISILVIGVNRPVVLSLLRWPVLLSLLCLGSTTASLSVLRLILLVCFLSGVVLDDLSLAEHLHQNTLLQLNVGHVLVHDLEGENCAKQLLVLFEQFVVFLTVVNLVQE